MAALVNLEDFLASEVLISSHEGTTRVLASAHTTTLSILKITERGSVPAILPDFLNDTSLNNSDLVRGLILDLERCNLL